MDSGDLGYQADGDLFVTGRQKDMIIKAGRNLYPQEMEEVVGGIPGVRAGCVAVFGVSDPAIGTERLVVVAESRETTAGGREALRARVIEAVVAALGIPPDAVVIAPPGSVLKTSSGKIRRSATRDAYLDGRLGRPRPSARVQWARLELRGLRPRLARLADGAGRVAFVVYAGALAALTLPALWGLLCALPEGRRADRLVRLWCRWILFLCGCRLRVDGLEHLRGVGPAILAANHASYLDAVALLAAIPTEFRFVAKQELRGTPLIRTVIRKAGHVAVERADVSRSVADAERVARLLGEGGTLLIFPEGTFVRAADLLPFRLGAFRAAVDAGRPVIPIALRGTREILPADTWLPRRGPITVAIAAPVAPAAGGGWREVVELRDRVRAEIARLLQGD
jgi:1-acyl-sn-glycerol-3-phosphate acyltransferase